MFGGVGLRLGLDGDTVLFFQRNNGRIGFARRAELVQTRAVDRVDVTLIKVDEENDI